MGSIPTPVLSIVPTDVDTAVSLAERDVQAYERFLISKREELERYEQRMDYLRSTLEYWRGVRDT